MREIIDLKTTNMTIDEMFSLENYILKNYKLIPAEMLED